MLDWSYGTAPLKYAIVIGNVHPGKFSSYSGAGKEYSGIDRFIATVVHEDKHTDQIQRADALMPASNGNDSFRYGWSWNKTPHNHWSPGPDGKWGVAKVDDDGNGTVDDAAPTPPFEPGNGDDVSLDHPTYVWWPNVWTLPSNPNAGGHPLESEAITFSNDYLNEDDYAKFDWGNPGKQHGTSSNYND